MQMLRVGKTEHHQVIDNVRQAREDFEKYKSQHYDYYFKRMVEAESELDHLIKKEKEKRK